MAPGREGSALLILRLRHADAPRPEGKPQLVATITTTTDLGTKRATRNTVGSVEEIRALVDCWIEAFTQGRFDDAVR